MGSFSLVHWLIMAVVLVLVLGGGRFSNMMGDVAKGIKQFKKGMADEDDDLVGHRGSERIEAKKAADARRAKARKASRSAKRCTAPTRVTDLSAIQTANARAIMRAGQKMHISKRGQIIALSTALQGRTSLVIAHRLSTVREADQILVVEDGRIVERGRHDELLERGGLYTELYRRQFAAQEDDPLAAADR